MIEINCLGLPAHLRGKVSSRPGIVRAAGSSQTWQHRAVSLTGSKQKTPTAASGSKLLPYSLTVSAAKRKNGGTGRDRSPKVLLTMYICDKQSQGIDWAAIFKRRPDLTPPGYQETVNQIQQEKTDDEQPEGDA